MEGVKRNGVVEGKEEDQVFENSHGKTDIGGGAGDTTTDNGINRMETMIQVQREEKTAGVELEVELEVEGRGRSNEAKGQGVGVDVDLNQTWPFTRCRIVLQREEDPPNEGAQTQTMTKPGGGGGIGGNLKQGWALEGTKYVFYDKITSQEVKDLNEQLQQSEASGMSRRRRRSSDILLRHGYHHPSFKTEDLNDPVLNNLLMSSTRGTGTQPEDVVSEAVFKCPFCLVVFPEGKGLIRHFGTHHNLYPKKKADEAAKKLPALPIKKEEGHEHDNDNLSPPPGKPSYLEIPSGNGKTMFQCSECGKKFKYYTKLVRHLPSHTDVKGFPCQLCPQALKSSWDLRRHVNECHLGLKSRGRGQPNNERRSFKCNLCPASYSRKYSLTLHIRSHTGEMPYSCSKCPRRFPVEGLFKLHLVTHSTKKNYKCPKCERRFKYPSSVVRHNTLNHS